MTPSASKVCPVGISEVNGSRPLAEKAVISSWKAVTIQPTGKHPSDPEHSPSMSQLADPAPSSSPSSDLNPANSHIDSLQTQSFCAEPEGQTAEQKLDEARRIRRLQLMMNMVMQVIQQDRSLPVEQASAMVADARRAALAMFPDKGLAFDLIFWPRLQRMMRERYRMQ
jgi:hypothetical protein